jgi:hypothetical protein
MTDETQKPQRCETCSGWLRQNPEVGLCRARPPVPIMVGQRQVPAPVLAAGRDGMVEPVVLTFFPQMLPGGWCREWQELKTEA